MGKRIFDNSPIEPVHSATVRLHEDLLTIYRTLREQLQSAIDGAFDQASQEIGYLVTTTVPYNFVLGDDGMVQELEIGSRHLRGTVFERTLTKALQPIKRQKFEVTAGGSYSLRLIWLEALKLRLKTHWLEPAHFRREWQEPAHLPVRLSERVLKQPPVGVREPAHWFDPGFAIAGEEKVLISVIDEVYPELSLLERIVAARTYQVERWPGTREPAHFRQTVPSVEQEEVLGVLQELAAVLHKHGF